MRKRARGKDGNIKDSHGEDKPDTNADEVEEESIQQESSIVTEVELEGTGASIYTTK